MVQEPGRVGGPYIAVLWDSRGWQDLYKVGEYSSETINDVDKQ